VFLEPDSWSSQKRQGVQQTGNQQRQPECRLFQLRWGGMFSFSVLLCEAGVMGRTGEVM
jgi:hypothetical protein